MKEKIYNYAFVVISDTRSTGENKDGCIDACQKIMPENYKMVYKSIINDDLENIENELNKLVDENIQLIFLYFHLLLLLFLNQFLNPNEDKV